jgi:hypothetical protein
MELSRLAAAGLAYWTTSLKSSERMPSAEALRMDLDGELRLDELGLRSLGLRYGELYY